MKTGEFFVNFYNIAIAIVKKRAIVKKGAIAKKEAIAKKRVIAKKGAINKIICFHSKTVLLV